MQSKLSTLTNGRDQKNDIPGTNGWNNLPPEGGWGLSQRLDEKLGSPLGTLNRATTPSYWEKSAEVVQAFGQDASW